MRSRLFTALAIIFSSIVIGFGSGCTTAKNTPKADPSKTIVMWHWLTDKEDVLNDLAREFYEKTGIYVKMEVFAPSEAYNQKIIASAQTNTLPEIYGILGSKRDFANFVKAGHVLKLDKYMDADNQKWRKRIFPEALKSVSFVDGNEFNVPAGVYGVPIDVINIQYIYNKKIFKAAGLDPDKPPQDIDEFLKAIEAIKKAGYQGLVSGFSEPWLIDCMASNFAWNIMGEEKMIATYKGEVSYTDPDWIKVFSIIEKMAKAGAFASGVVIKSNKDAELEFALEKDGFAFNGSWAVHVYKDMNPEIEIGIILPPKVSNANPRGIWGGAGTWFAVNAKSGKREMAVEFLDWLTQPEQQVRLAKETLSIPSVRGCMSSVPEELKGFLSGMKYVYHPRNFPVQEDSIVVEAFDKGLQSIVTGEKTAEQVAQEVQKVKERQMKKAQSQN